MFSVPEVLFFCSCVGIVGFVAGGMWTEREIDSGNANEEWLLHALEMCRWRKSMPAAHEER